MSNTWLNLGRVGHGVLVGTEDRAIAVFYGPNSNPQSESDIELALNAVNKTNRCQPSEGANHSGPLFEICSEQEWLQARRGQSRSGNVPLDHADIAAAVEFLSTAKIGTAVKVRCTEALQDRKRGAAIDHASRRHLSVRTKYHDGYVLIRLEN